MRPGIAVNAARCMACYACFMACKDEHCGWGSALTAPQPRMGQYWMNIVEWERGDSEREDGVVIIDPEKAKGQKQIVEACPIGAIYWNEELQLAQKCTMCAELMDDPDYPGKEPRCVEACPNQALVYGDLDDPESEVSKLIAANKVTPLEGLEGMNTQVVHLNVPSAFLAGTVYMPEEEEEVCIGADVKITCEECGCTYETKSNWAGDWEFEDLPKGKSWTVEISYPGYKSVKYTGERTDKDHYVAMTYLEKE